MDKFYKPTKCFDLEPQSPNVDKEWTHWKRTFSGFISAIERSLGANDPPINKLDLLCTYVSSSVYDYISEAQDYDSAITILDTTYVKPKSEIYARHILATRKQESGENLDQFLQALYNLAKECEFKAVDANRNREDHVRDAYISGLRSGSIRQRLLESKNIRITDIHDQARTLELAERRAESWSSSSCMAMESNSSKPNPTEKTKDVKVGIPEREDSASLNAVNGNVASQSCYFCGYSKHQRDKCPAKTSTCAYCKKVGHWARVCKNAKTHKQKQTETDSTVAVLASTTLTTNNDIPIPQKLQKSSMKIRVNDLEALCLVDSCSSESFIDLSFAKTLKLIIHPVQQTITLATKTTLVQTVGYVHVNIEYNNTKLNNVKLTVLKSLCCSVLIGHDILKCHSSLEISFGGPKSKLSICSLATLDVKPPPLFQNLDPKITPIADKSRYYSKEDKEFIQCEVTRLISEGIIENSLSPWRAQVVVVTQNSGKKRMVIDYSRTINRYTYLDAYPLPKIDTMVNDISQYSYYSSLDLRSAYHQVPIRSDEKIFTAFEANGKFYQFTRVPFGITNGVACFQRVIDEIIDSEKLSGTYAFIDNITVCGKTKAEHDRNLEHFYNVAKKYKFTFNEDKSIISVEQLSLLGYLISKGEIRPDPERLKSLLNLSPPTNHPSLKRVLGFFSYYAQWIPNYSEKSRPLNLLSATRNKYVFTEKELNAFKIIKQDIVSAVRTTIDEDLPFVVETDASDHSVAATLNQGGQPVAFYSRTLNKSECNYPSIEKEACAIVEALKKWRHYLMGRKFLLITDQRSISFMFDDKTKGKVKNEKINRWRIELSCYKFEISYRKGIENKGADMFSRTFNCAISEESSKLYELHKALCHPGVTRLAHFVRTRNLPYSVEEIKRTVGSCSICAKLKPRYTVRPEDSSLIKATRPFERLSVDFKGPVPSVTKNKYILTIVDEFSRFPFAYACPDMTSSTVIYCFSQLFAIFGMPNYIHSDQGTSFMSSELREFLTRRGIATSRSTPYNPEGNGQCERYNGIIWKSIQLACASKNLDIENWEVIMSDALHSIRSLLCTATNETPHERMFAHPRRTSNGTALPTWLLNSNKVLLKRMVRKSKNDPLADEVELLETNPNYAHVRLSDGREATVSLKQLSPYPTTDSDDPNATHSGNELSFTPPDSSTPAPPAADPEQTPSMIPSSDNLSNSSNEPRYPTRVRRPPDRLMYR